MNQTITQTDGESINPRLALAALLLFTLVVRGGVLVLTHNSLAADPDAYRQVAANLLAHGVLGHGQSPTAFRPPVYPLLVAGCMTVDPSATWSVGLLHLACGLVTVALAWSLGRRCGLGAYAPLPGVLVAVDPILLRHATLVMTETVATLAACLALWMLTRAADRPATGRSAAAGACLALASLCRPTFLICTAAGAVLLPWFGRRWTRRMATATAFTLGAAVVLAPWMVRNQVQFGRPIPGTTHGGYTLLLGNNPSFYDYLRRRQWGDIWDASTFHASWQSQAAAAEPNDEVSLDRLAYSDARAAIRQEPGSFAWSCVVRVGRLWTPLPHRLDQNESSRRRMARYAVAAWYTIELALAAVGLIVLIGRFVSRRRIEAPWLWAIALAVSFTAIHAFYWSNMRMRAPLTPVLALCVATAVTQWRSRRSG